EQIAAFPTQFTALPYAFSYAPSFTLEPPISLNESSGNALLVGVCTSKPSPVSLVAVLVSSELRINLETSLSNSLILLFHISFSLPRFCASIIKNVTSPSREYDECAGLSRSILSLLPA